MKKTFAATAVSKLFALLLAIAVLMTLLTVMVTPASAEDAAAEDTEQTAGPTEKWSDFAADDFEGGSGTETDPYLIATAEQLAKLSNDVAGSNTLYERKWFKLTNDIDLSGKRWNPIGQYKWLPDYTSPGNEFRGNFDGNGKTVRGIYVDEATDGWAGGLFGCIVINGSGSGGPNLIIRDLTIENAEIHGNGNGLFAGSNGILALKLMGSTDNGRIIVENVHVSGTVDVIDGDKVDPDGYYAVGGMCGNVDYVDFIDCSVDSFKLTGLCDNSGGFVGMSNSSTYTDCIARGAIDGRWAMGGFVGYVSKGVSKSVFTRCVANVDVTASNWNVGGFCGYCSYGVITDCASFGNIKSSVTSFAPRVSGFVGKLDDSSMTDCFVGGSVESDHPTVAPSVFVAMVDETAAIKGCTYNSDKNQNLNAFSNEDGSAVTSFTATALSTDEHHNAVCDSLYGHHQYEGNTCRICGLKQVYINSDGYWVIDGKATDIKAVAENIVAEGKGASVGLAVAAVIIGSAALACDVAFIAYAFTKKKKAS